MEKSKVYFTKKITPETVIQMYQVLGRELPGKVAVKARFFMMNMGNYC